MTNVINRYLSLFVYAGAIVLVYYSALTQMVFHDWAREDYSHSYLIPFVVLYLLWEKRAALASIPSTPSWIGLIPFVFGLSLYWLGELGGEFYTLYVSLWFVIVGLAWMHLGWRKLKEMSFALFMILTMFPFPNFINNKILVGLRLISSQLGVWMLHIYGMSAYREGNVIDLGFTQLQVVDACSGLRYVIPLAVLSLVMAYWFKAAFWKKALLVLSSLPLAIAVNSFRIAATGVLYSIWGAGVAESFFHGFSGWLIFVFTLPVLLLEMWILKKLPPRGDRKIGTDTYFPAVNGNRSLFSPLFFIPLLLLVLTFALSRGVEFRENVPIKKSFSEFPLSVGAWTGTRQIMEKQFIDVLHFNDYIMAGYRNPQGREIDFYVAYYESQRKGETTHSPETCLPGSGWSFEQAGVVGIPVAVPTTAKNGTVGEKGTDTQAKKGTDTNFPAENRNQSPFSLIKVNRAFMEKGGSRQLVYFWFPQRGRILTSLYQVKLYSFWDALIRQRTDGALVRVITPVYGDENLQNAELRLQEFTKEVVPVLDVFLPK
jgi:exosortase D (VPLPA-CTERM-specific)